MPVTQCLGAQRSEHASLPGPSLCGAIWMRDISRPKCGRPRPAASVDISTVAGRVVVHPDAAAASLGSAITVDVAPGSLAVAVAGPTYV